MRVNSEALDVEINNIYEALFLYTDFKIIILSANKKYIYFIIRLDQ